MGAGMKKIEIDELKKIQLQILDDVVAFCDKENLTYFLAYGTLIGAIRHNGYIPWDDDIDLVMPRDDYDYFLRHYNRSTERYKVLDYEVDSKYLYPFGKVIDTETFLNENCYIGYELGVNIDIFPLDEVDAAGKMLRHERMVRKIIFFKTMPWSNKRSLMKNIVLTLGRGVFSVVPLESLIKHTICYAKKLRGTGSEKLSVPVDGASSVKVWEKKWFEEMEYHQFEGKEYKIPKEYDVWLRAVYGNYMELPPEDQRESLHDIEAYWR